MVRIKLSYWNNYKIYVKWLYLIKHMPIMFIRFNGFTSVYIILLIICLIYEILEAH